MFTGIISGIGRIVQTHPLGAAASYGLRLLVETPGGYLNDTQLGDSIAVNGACMTVTELDPLDNRFSIDVSAESLDKTCGLQQPGPVNLEKALRANDRLGGHLVSGHVDGIAAVLSIDVVGESRELLIRTGKSIGRYLAYKGSVTVNGVSLTVNRVEDDAEGCVIGINLIPHTLTVTTLGSLQAGHSVNLEVDLIARYVERTLNAPTPGA